MRSILLVLFATLLACARLAPASSDVTHLENGEVVSGLYGLPGHCEVFRLTVPPARQSVTITLSGIDPDADLYVRWNAIPTPTQHTAKSTGSSSNESITITNPPAGDLFILVYAYETFFNVSLQATHVGPAGGGGVPGGPTTWLANGVQTAKFAGGDGSARLFAIQLPNGATRATFSMWGGSGDADLYIRWGAPPTLTQYDERPYLEGNNESVTVTNPAGGTVYLLVHGFDAYSGVRLRVTVLAWKHFSHKHGAWKNQTIGSSSIKIKQGGAALASLAMALSYAGSAVDPGTLNGWLKSHNGFSGGATVKWSAAAEFDGSGRLTYLGPSQLTTPAKLRQALDAGQVVLARSSRFGTNDHWVVIRRYAGNGSSWSQFRYWDPADASPGTDRSIGDGWVGGSAKTRIFAVEE
jgi:hypothetical protein